MTLAEQWRREGEAGARRAVLEKLMRLKFGTLDAEHATRVQAASPEDLDRWLERILTADSPDAVLEG